MTTGYKWTVEEEHLLRLLRSTNTYQEIADEFTKRFSKDLPGFRCLRTAEAIRKKCERHDITPETSSQYTVQNNPVVDRWEEIEDIGRQYAEDSCIRRQGLIPPEKITTKILSLSDIHFPLTRIEFLKEILDLHNDADVVVINGDMLEGYVFSTFEKSRRIAALHEYNMAYGFIEMLSENYPKVVIVEGNHDNRASRALKGAGFEKEASQILRPNLLARIANGERLDSTGMLIEKKNFNNVIFQQHESWYVKIGKTLFIHPSTRGTSKPGYTVQQWDTKFQERYQPGEYDSIVCGHTHQIYKGVLNSRLLIEQGCLAGLLGYAWSPRTFHRYNGQNGYAVVYQDAEGNTDFNLSTPVFLGEVMPPKKSAI